MTMALGFSIFNLATFGISQIFLSYKYFSFLNEHLTIKNSDLYSTLTSENSKKFSKLFTNVSSAAIGFTAFNIISTGLVDGFTFGNDISLVGDLMFSMGSLIAAFLIVTLSNALIDKMSLKDFTNEISNTPAIPSIA